MRNERLNGKEVRLAEAGRTTRNVRATHHPVWFEYTNGAAREVAITGSFNKWDVSNMPLVRLTGGRWLRVMFLPPGRYEYLFVVDGRCVADPSATESVPNVFGCENSVVSLPANVAPNRCIGRTNRHAERKRFRSAGHAVQKQPPCRTRGPNAKRLGLGHSSTAFPREQCS